MYKEAIEVLEEELKKCKGKKHRKALLLAIVCMKENKSG